MRANLGDHPGIHRQAGHLPRPTDDRVQDAGNRRCLAEEGRPAAPRSAGVRDG